MHRTQVYLNEAQVNLAKLYAAQEGIAFSEFIRQGVDLAIKAKQTKIKGKRKGKRYDPLGHMVGKFSFGDGRTTNVALTHNDIYDL